MSSTDKNQYLSFCEITSSFTFNPAPRCAIYGADYAICTYRYIPRKGIFNIRGGVYVCAECAYGLKWKKYS